MSQFETLDMSGSKWEEKASCLGVDPNMFFPDIWLPIDLRRKDEVAAKAVCGLCVVREECLDHALRNGEKQGIWGGHTEQERKKMSPAP